MPVEAPVAFALFLLENDDLIGAALIENLAIDCRLGDGRGADLGCLAVFANHQDVFQLDIAAGFAEQFFNENNVAGRHAILLTAGLYDCVHFLSAFRHTKGRVFNHSRRKARKLPPDTGPVNAKWVQIWRKRPPAPSPGCRNLDLDFDAAVFSAAIGGIVAGDRAGVGITNGGNAGAVQVWMAQ